MDKNQKNELISSLKKQFNEATTVVIAHYSGLSVAEMSFLRTQMRLAGGTVKIFKNRLAKIATVGTSKEALSQILVGPVIIAFSTDPIVAAKVFSEFSKKNAKLVIVGGILEDKILDSQAVDSLAMLPSLDELRGKLVGLIQAPAVKIAGVIAAPPTQLVRLFNAYATKVA